ncbi:MAG: hypothetical protein V7K68_26475 [Nostoc sp.]|uniref:hypothetical protein n=1 Tax=Nostoc sp. TaxID=1180 RepID=UPI002FF6E984
MKNSTHKDMEFLGMGHGAWGMGHGAWGMGNEVSNAQCPMPQATGRLSLCTHKGMEFPVAFNESSVAPHFQSEDT